MEVPPKPTSLLDWLQRLLLLAASISGILIVAGYVIVNAGFAIYGLQMPLYTVSVNQYVIAGTYFLLQFVITTTATMFFVWYAVKALFYSEDFVQVLETYLPGLWSVVALWGSIAIVLVSNQTISQALVQSAVITGFTLVIILALRKLVGMLGTRDLTIKRFLPRLNIKFPPFGRLITAIRHWISHTAPGWRKYLFVAIPFSFIFSLVACVTSYTKISPTLGGGRPTCVNLVFKDPDSIEALDFSPHSSIRRRTGRVSILAITNDGFLVVDEGKGRAIAVKNDLIEGYVGCDPLGRYLTPTIVQTTLPFTAIPGTQSPLPFATSAAPATP